MTAFGGHPDVDPDLARWLEVSEWIHEDPEFLPRVQRSDPDLYMAVCLGLRRLAITARWEEWRSPLSGVGGRPDQLIPGTPGSSSDRTDWLVWALLGGRGSGKSRTGAEAIREMALWDGWTSPPRGALVGQTLDAVRIDMVENTLLQVLPPGSVRQWNRGPCELWLTNGAYLKGYSSEVPRKLRGPNFHFGWADELATFADADKSPGADSTFSNLKLATRAHNVHTWVPRIIVTTTPRPVRILRNPDPADPINPGPGVIDDPLTVVTSMSTLENLENLAAHYVETVVKPLEGTRLYDQEILGQLLNERLGALWSYEQVSRMRCAPSWPELQGGGFRRIVVGVDPSMGAGLGNECGIVVMGLAYDGIAYVLEDASLRAKPEVWVQKLARVCRRWDAETVVVEVNQGGQLVEETIGRYAPTIPLVTVFAKRGKQLRAEPVALLSDQGRLRLAGDFGELERQMRTWAPEEDDDSPDRVDAMVYAALWLLPTRAGLSNLVKLTRRPRR